MEDVVHRSFASEMPIALMEKPLVTAGGLDWQSRETHDDGFYLRGLTPNGVKVRLLARADRFAVEVHFPIGAGWTRFTDEQKREFIAWLSSHVLAAVGAKDVRDEPQRA